MREFIGHVRRVLDRRTKTKLMLGSLGLITLALLDMVAVALVYPMVSLASGVTPDSRILDPIRQLSTGNDTHSLLVTTAVMVVALFIAKSAASIAFNWWLAGLTNRSRAAVSTHLLRVYLTTPYGQISQRTTADLLKVQQDAVNQFMLAGVYALVNGVANMATIVGLGAVLFYTAPLQTTVLVGYFLLTAVLYLRVVRPATERAGRETISSAGLTWRSAMTALGAVKEIQLRSAELPFVHQYDNAVQRAAQAHRVSGFIAGLPRYILEVLFILAVGLAIVLSSDTEGGATLGLLGVFVAAGFRLLPAVTGLLGNISTLTVSEESARYVARDWKTFDDATREASAMPLPMERELVLSEVCFQYQDAADPVLDHVSLRVPKGSSVALVGPSGSGKTTLVDLVLGFYEPTSGLITADGIDVFSDISAWRANIAYVPQDVFLIEGTIEDNIAFEADRADESAHAALLSQAIMQADLEGLIAGLPDGVRTQVGERGSRLSGGQKQRIGMARALYRRPRLLILDEATSALDNATEQRVSGVIHGLGEDVTTIVVAHRLSTVREADAIVLLEEGHVSAIGTFEELRASSSSFADLVRLGDLT
ncbi:ABC transporter ATP-binding protein [Janibacter sp. DB-40]|uniref:ABC transporter ATP-binding protein n=1 Tax=Janibacter sp. DB-40 TaxID=3028808 RepID=UPI00240610CA|nr:ABC transporter ATP-binding protein [Janibacter sp. DB-40]